MKIDEHLKAVYAPSGDLAWIEKNRFIFEEAKVFGLAVAGSIGLGLGKKTSSRPPGDIDLVCPSFSDAQAFIASLERKLTEYSVHWRVGVNHRNPHVPVGAITHFRFTTAMWLPVCIFVVPIEKFRFWLTPVGLRVQLFDIAQKAQIDLQQIDGKAREELPDDVDPSSLEHAGEPEAGPSIKFNLSSFLSLEPETKAYHNP